MFAGKELFYSEEFEKITSTSGICNYIDSSYTYEYDAVGYCKNPEETFNSRKGDCEDFAVLFLNICYYKYNIKGSIVLINTNELPYLYPKSRNIVGGGEINHAVVLFNGIIYDPSFPIDYSMIGTFEQRKNIIKYQYSFDEIFR
jgi:hypothetical protein